MTRETDSSVLLFCSKRVPELRKILGSAGAIVSATDSMLGGLDSLRHGRFAAVVVDQRTTPIDVLELVLNIRDVDAAVPVVIVGRPKETEVAERVREVSGIEVFERGEGPETLVRCLRRLLGSA